MERHEPPALPADSSLPRPIVLRPEDLAAVAAAGAALLPALTSRIIIAGGITVGPLANVAAAF
jgi:hypothetical protein